VTVARVAVVLAVVAAIGGSPAAAIELVPAKLPDALVGSPYSFQLAGEDGCPASYHFTFSSGRLPPGLTIADKGLINGTPTEAGTFQFYVDLRDECVGDSHTQRQYTMIVAPRLVVTTTALAPARLGALYSVQLTAVGGGTSVSDGALPAGLTLSSSGLLSGTPTTAGSFTFTVKVADPARSGTQQLTLVVAAPLSVSPPTASVGEVGVSYSAAPTVSGGAPPLVWSVTSGMLPAGLALNGSTGAISGAPRVAGVFQLTVSASSGDGANASVDVALRIAARLVVGTRRLPAAHVGSSYSTRLTTRGGVAPVRWTLARGTLPAGLRLSTTGKLAGKPMTSGSATIVVKATDRLGVAAIKRLVLTVSSS
jgi:hypothetical protein